MRIVFLKILPKKIIFNVDFIFAIGISEHDTEIS